MIVQRKWNREFWFSSALNTVPDLLISGVIAFLSDGGLLLFVGAFFGLQVIYFLVWLRKIIWFWFRYIIRDKKRITQHIPDLLIVNKFPKPGAVVDSAEGYLDEVAAKETVDIKVRLLAAAELGAMCYAKNAFHSKEYLALSTSYDGAIEEYGRKINHS